MNNNTESVAVRQAGHRNLTQGNILNNLLSLCWPMLISDGLNLSGPTIDMLWVGRLGPADIAGVGVSGLILNLVNLGIMGVNIGLRALVGRLIGKNDLEGAKNVGRQAVVLSIIYSTLVAAILIIFTKPILSLFGVEPNVVSEGALYLQLALVGVIPTSIHRMAEAIMQASGDSVTPMKISLAMRITHVCFDPFLIFGWWIFPRMGVSGAALANTLAAVVGAGTGLIIVFSGRTRVKFTLRHYRLDIRTMGRILKIGIPSSVSSAQRSFGGIMVMGFISPFGTLAVASYSLLTRIQQFASTTNAGFGRAGAVLVAQNLGAGQPKRSEKSTWLAMALSESVILILAALMMIWSKETIRIFTTDAELVNYAVVLLKIMVLGYALTACQSILSQCLIGSGDTIPAMLIDVICMWVITLPLAFILSKSTSLGISGIWWALAIGIWLSATAYFIYFRIGRWKRKII